MANENDILYAFVDKVDAVNLVLIAVIAILAWLLSKTTSRMDTFLSELKASGQTQNKLTMLLEGLVYGRRKGKGDTHGD